MKNRLKKYLSLFMVFLMMFQNAEIVSVVAQNINISELMSTTEDTESETTENNEEDLNSEEPSNLEEGIDGEELTEETSGEEKTEEKAEENLEIPETLEETEGKLEVETEEQLAEEVSILLEVGNYNSLTKEEKDILLMELSLREDTMSILAENGYTVNDSINKARIMQQLDIGLEEVNKMVENFQSEDKALTESTEFKDYVRDSVTLSNIDRRGLIELLVSGKSTREALDIYAISLLLDKDINDVIGDGKEGVKKEEVLKPEEIKKEPEKIVEETEEIKEEIPKNTEEPTEMPENSESEIETVVPEEILTGVAEVGSATNKAFTNTLGNKLIAQNINNNIETIPIPVTNMQEENSEPEEEKLPEDKENGEETEGKEEGVAGEGIEGKTPEGEEAGKETGGETPEGEKTEVVAEIEKKFELTQEDLDKALEYSNKNNVKYELLVEYMTENKIHAEGLVKVIDYIKKANKIEAKKMISPMSTYSAGDTITNREPSAAYVYKNYFNESVRSNTGALVFTDKIVELQGKGGLNLNLSLIYDSSDATGEEARGESLEFELRRKDTSTIMDYFEMPVNFTHHKSVGLLNQKRFIATGWAMNTTRIERGSNYSMPYLKLSSGGAYAIEEWNGEIYLSGYRLKDIKLEKDKYAVYKNSAWIVKYNDGRSEYISGEGNIVAQRDRFGNEITFTDTDDGRLIIKDSVGREIEVKFENKLITITFPDGSTIKYEKEIPTVEYGSNYRQLSSKIDQTGRRTTFTYKVDTADFDFYKLAPRSRYVINNQEFRQLANQDWYSLDEFRFAKNFHYDHSYDSLHYSPIYSYLTRLNYHNLVKVTHPTGESTNYEYMKRLGNLGGEGNREYYSISKRYDLKDGVKSNIIDYKYWINESDKNTDYSGYGKSLSNNANLPSGYKYYFVETPEGGESVVTTFNRFHEIDEVSKGNEKTTYKYNFKDLKEKVTKTIKGTTGASIEIIEMYEYDDYGNVTGYWGPKAEGNRSAEHKKTFKYDETYNQLISVEYKEDSNKTIKSVITLTGDKKTPSNEKKYVNDTLISDISYTYNLTNGNLMERITGNGLIEERFSYDEHSNLTGASIDGIGEKITYDKMGRVTEITDKNKNKIKYVIDPIGRITQITNADGSTVKTTYNDITNEVTTTNGIGTVTKHEFDFNGNLLKSVDIKTGNVLRETKYNKNSLVEWEKDGKGIIVKYSYDKNFRIISKTIDNTYVEKYIYNEAYDSIQSQVIKIIPASEGMPEMKTAMYTDKYGNKSAESGFLGNEEIKTTYEYDYSGNMVSFLNPKDRGNGQTYTAKYEYQGQKDPIKTIDALGNIITTNYDLAGRKISTIDAKGNEFKTIYDKQSNVIEAISPFEGTNKVIIKYTYDKNGNVLTSLAPVNKPGEELKEIESKYKYDEKNQLIQSEIGETIVSYKYDKIGNKTTMNLGEGAQINTYGYDHLGQLTIMKDANGISERYEYDKVGNLISKIDKNGNTIKNQYNNLNTIVSTNIHSISGVSEEYLKYSYNGNNNLIKEENENLTTEYEYDSLGRVIKQSDSTGTVKEYEYDKNNNRIKLKLYLNGSLTLNTEYEYDRLNRLVKVLESGEMKAMYSYDKNGNRITKEDGSGITTRYTYNDANQIKTLTNKRNSEVISSYEYSYYLSGNQASKKDKDGNITSYEYDDEGRLLEEKEEGIDKDITRRYYYDKLSNRLQMTEDKNGSITKTTYEYDKTSKLLKEQSSNGKAGEKTIITYSYDGNGNQIRKTTGSIELGKAVTEPGVKMYILNLEQKEEMDLERFTEEIEGQVREITGAEKGRINMSILEEDANETIGDYKTEESSWDGFNRLRRTSTGKMTATYEYKGDGLRLSKEVNGIVTTHVWDGSNMVVDLDNEGDVKDKYIRGLELIESEEEGYYVYDGHGDVVQLVEESGEVRKEYKYDAFGVEENIDEEDTNPFRYCGEYFDKETGRIYLRARYYTPTTGRFMSEDPIRDGLNFYTYAVNNPVRYNDPTGLSSTLEQKTWAHTQLKSIAKNQYPALFLADLTSPSPVVNIGDIRVDWAISQALKNKASINKVSSETGIPPEILGGIIFKEMVTQSLPDGASMFVNEINGSLDKASVGLGANSIKGTRSAWEWYAKEYGVELPDYFYDDKKYLKQLKNNNEFNIKTSSILLLYVASHPNFKREDGSKLSLDVNNIKGWTDQDWKDVLYNYNSANGYNEKVMEYLKPMKTLLD